ncbi:MAG: hypothetical protein ACREBF_03945 [Candidatus Micrarchaeales archaeon]
MVMIKRDIVKDTTKENGLNALKRGEEMKGIRQNKNKEEVALLEINGYLSLAAKYQPCPACRHDIEVMEEFISRKITSLQDGKSLEKEEIKKLEAIDSVNEMINFGIVMTKILSPFTRNLKAPALYKDIFQNGIEPNKKVKIELLKASKVMEELPKGPDYLKMEEILDSFLRAVEFKLSIDPVLFYVFDSTIKTCYKLHILDVVAATVIGIKNIRKKLSLVR